MFKFRLLFHRVSESNVKKKKHFHFFLRRTAMLKATAMRLQLQRLPARLKSRSMVVLPLRKRLKKVVRM